MYKNSPPKHWQHLNFAFLILVSACGPNTYATLGNRCDDDVDFFCPSESSKRITAPQRHLFKVTPDAREGLRAHQAAAQKSAHVEENTPDLKADENAFWISEEEREENSTHVLFAQESLEETALAAPIPPPRNASFAQAALPAQQKTPSRTKSFAAPAEISLTPEDHKVYSLKEALLSALSQNPKIIMASSRLREAKSLVLTAESARKLQLKARVGLGYQFIGNYGGNPSTAYFSKDKGNATLRTETSLTSKNLIYDFGATRQGIANKKKKEASEYFKLQEEISVVSEKIFEIYLNIKRERETLAASEENIQRLRKLRNLLKKNQENGNATKADLDRLQSRLINAKTSKSDILNNLQDETDAFIEIVHLPPGEKLKEPQDLSFVIPSDFATAKKYNDRMNPRLLALQKDVEASSHELKKLKRATYPVLRFENTLQFNDSRSTLDRTDLEAKSLLTLNYNLYDGGATKSRIVSANENLIQKKFELIAEKKSENTFLRKNYRSIENTSSKKNSLTENVRFARTARDLYYKQYKAGEKSLLELIDVEENYFQARLNHIENKFEKIRATYKAASMLGVMLPNIFENKPLRARTRNFPARRKLAVVGRRRAASRGSVAPHPVPRPIKTL